MLFLHHLLLAKGKKQGDAYKMFLSLNLQIFTQRMLFWDAEIAIFLLNCFDPFNFIPRGPVLISPSSTKSRKANFPASEALAFLHLSQALTSLVFDTPSINVAA
jgi:hypothetical protein